MYRQLLFFVHLHGRAPRAPRRLFSGAMSGCCILTSGSWRTSANIKKEGAAGWLAPVLCNMRCLCLLLCSMFVSWRRNHRFSWRQNSCSLGFIEVTWRNEVFFSGRRFTGLATAVVDRAEKSTVHFIDRNVYDKPESNLRSYEYNIWDRTKDLSSFCCSDGNSVKGVKHDTQGP